MILNFPHFFQIDSVYSVQCTVMMELSQSYAPNYFSLDDILATQERVPCR